MITKRGYRILKSVIVMYCGREKSFSIREISDRMVVPPKTMEHVLVALCKAGILASKRGPRGGYFLLEKAGDMTIAEVLEKCNEKLTIMPARYRENMDDEADEILAHVGEIAGTALIKNLDEFTMKDLAEIINNKVASKSPIYAI